MGPASVAVQPWLYHHLTVSGPSVLLAEFLEAARGPGVVPWRLDQAAVEEDMFNLAASQPPHRRTLTVEGCRVLARQLRAAVERHEARLGLVDSSRACPFDLHSLLPVPNQILQLGPNDASSCAWLRENWGVAGRLRRPVLRPSPMLRPNPVLRPNATLGRRLAHCCGIVGYGFFTGGDTPHSAIAQLARRWPALHLDLQPKPAD